MFTLGQNCLYPFIKKGETRHLHHLNNLKLTIAVMRKHKKKNKKKKTHKLKIRHCVQILVQLSILKKINKLA